MSLSQQRTLFITLIVPFGNSAVENAFWQFEREVPKFIFLPDWRARYGERSRRVATKAFESYYTNNYHEHASALVRDFYASEVEYGFSCPTALCSRSAIPLQFWATLPCLSFGYVFSSTGALHDIRKEISTIIPTTVGAENEKRHHVDMAKVSTNCPTLVSAFRETLRLHSIGISLRHVCKDTVLNDIYSLRKDATHKDPRV